MGIVRIKISVGVPMVGAVSTRPPLDRSLHSTGTYGSKEVLQRL